MKPIQHSPQDTELGRAWGWLSSGWHNLEKLHAQVAEMQCVLTPAINPLTGSAMKEKYLIMIFGNRAVCPHGSFDETQCLTVRLPIGF